ncbi:hypothetical protein Tco_1262438 [Tanacetum coccineum]
MVAYLEKSEGSAGLHEIIDFLSASHIHYALTENPTIYVSFIKQFWSTAAASTRDNGEVELTTTIDGHTKTLTEASLRRHLKLEDNGGVSTLTNSEIFKQLALMGYGTDSDKLTFQMGNFSPQWRFLIHTILHCLSPKKTAWDQFSSNIATAIICLATNRTYNFSKMIFDAMVKNVDSPQKFLMYPRELGRTTKLVEDQCSGEKDEREVSTVGLPISTPTITPDVSTASERGSAAGIKAKDKGKGIMQESMPSKKIKKMIKIQMTVDDELAKKVFEEEQARFNAEQEARAKKEQEQEKQSDTIKRYQTLRKKLVSVAQARKNMMICLRNMAGYKMDYFKGMSYDDIRPIFEVEYNKVQTLFKNRDVEEEKGQKVLEESAEKTETEQVKIESSKKDGGTRKKSLARKRARETLSEENAKKQKLEDDDEKEELQGYISIVSEDEGLDVESLATKYPIVDWETCYYQIKRVDGSVKHYNLFSVMLYDFDRQDVQELYKLVKERFQTRSPEGYDLLL